jgi:hypothetical protein
MLIVAIAAILLLPMAIAEPASARGARVVTCVRPTSASLREEAACYKSLMKARHVHDTATSAELPSVAANFCDNTVSDMSSYLSLLADIGSQHDAVSTGASLADAFCPSSRLQLTAAAQELGAKLPKPPIYKSK